MTPHNLDPEVDFHLEMLVRRYVEEGLDPDAARARALARMGGLEAARRAGPPPREPLWRSWGQDLRHACRGLRRAPGFTLIAVAMLALGTGISASVFSVVDAVILRSAFTDTDAVALVHLQSPEGRLHSGLPRDAYDRMVDALPPSIEALGIAAVTTPIVTRVDLPRRTQAECVTASMGTILGTRPRMRRWFSADEDRPGGPPVAVVSDRFHRGALGGDPQAVGRVIALDDQPVTIIGVMPAGFDGPFSRINRDLWLPLGPSTDASPFLGCRAGSAIVNAVVRLGPGTTMTAGANALNAAGGIDEVVLTPIVEGATGDLRNPFIALAGAVLAVLLIAVVNVTNLGLERLAGRRHELAVRLALGATRWRLIRASVSEHLLVAAAGAVLGLALAALSFDAIVSLLPATFPNLATVSLNGPVILACTLLTLASGLVSGLLAAWQSPAQSPQAALASNTRGATRSVTTTRRMLVSLELALGVLLLVGALLMIQTFLTLRPADPGFDPTDKQLALARLPESTTHSERAAFVSDVSLALSTTPGITAVAATTYVPMSRSINSLELEVGAATGRVYVGTVTPNYFDVMRIPVLRGRGLSVADDTGPLVAVVNEAFVRRWLRDVEPLGAVVAVESADGPVSIVGVIGDMRSIATDTRARPELYMAFSRLPLGSPYFVVNGSGGRSAATFPQTMRDVVNRVRPGQLVDRIESYEGMLGAELSRPRLGAWLFGVFAALAVLLGAVGLAATLAWSVACRRREIGIRIALGARPVDVQRLIVGQSLGMSVAGVVAGLLAAAATTRLLEGWLYGVTPLDAGALAAGGLGMLVVALGATWVPSHRAAAVDPATTLRGDAS